MFSGTKGYLTKPKPGVMLNPLHPLSQGLVGYWLFNEGAGSRANDISGHGNHGTLENMSPNVQGSGWGGSKFGGGLEFDGVDDYVSTNLYPDDVPKTLNVWLCFTDVSVMYNAMGCHDGNNHRWYIGTASNDIYCGVGNSYIYTTPHNLADREWFMYTVVADGSTARVYINGVERDSFNYTWTGDSTNAIWIGAINAASKHHINGGIDNVRYYNRALAAREIKQLYHDPFCNLLRVPTRRWYVPLAGTIAPTSTFMDRSWVHLEDRFK